MGKQLRRRIVYYNGHYTATDALAKNLSTLFREKTQPVTSIGASGLAQGQQLDSAHTALLILPGIAGDISPYPHDLGDEAMENIVNFVANGGHVLGLCAGAAHLAHHVVFEPVTRASRNCENAVHLFNGAAYGPVDDHVSTINGDSYNSIDLATLRFEDSDTNSRDIVIPYSNGLAFYPDDGERLTIHARYADIPGQPAAIASKAYGQGKVVLCGVHPEISKADIETAYNTLPEAGKLAPVIDALAGHDNDRAALFETLVTALSDSHYHKGGNRPAKLLHLSL